MPASILTAPRLVHAARAHRLVRPASLLAGGLLALASLGTAAVPAAAASARQASYTTPGTYSWTVPAGVTAATFTALGAAGGSYFADGVVGCIESPLNETPGGSGAMATVTVPVVPGQVYTLTVASTGRSGDYCAFGIDEGGLPGGGTSIPFDPTGGGGGGGYSEVTGPGGFVLLGGGGGGAGSGPMDAASLPGTAGGAGGTPNGGAGAAGSSPESGGGGGTQTAGGLGGFLGGFPGASLRGADALSDCGSAGAGGGGYYGGGSGGTSSCGYSAGGGGGGSSYGPPGTTYQLQPSPDGRGDGAVTVTVSQTASLAPSTTLAVAPAVVEVGEPTTLTVTASGSAPATSTVELGGTAMGGCANLAGSSIQCPWTPQSTGTVTLQAVTTRAGGPSTASAPTTVTVVRAATESRLVAKGPIRAGRPVTVVTTVTTVAGSGIPLGGSVTFARFGSAIAACEAVPLSPAPGGQGATASCTTTLPAGLQIVTANYSGDAATDPQVGFLAVRIP